MTKRPPNFIGTFNVEKLERIKRNQRLAGYFLMVGFLAAFFTLAWLAAHVVAWFSHAIH